MKEKEEANKNKKKRLLDSDNKNSILGSDLKLMPESKSIEHPSISSESESSKSLEDLEKLLNMNPNFVQLENSSTNSLLYRYLEI